MTTAPRAVEAPATYHIGHFIDGEVVAGDSGRRGEVAQPATGEIQASVAFASTEEVDRAVGAARRAFEDWSRTPVVQRAAVMFRARELLREHADELAALLVREHGKVWGDAQGELTRGFEVVDFACGIPHLLKGEFSEQVGAGIDSWSVRQPLGVVAAVTPFNFPAMLPLWTLPIAIACGNTFVLKPSEKDPSCGLRLAELFSQAGVPDGVVNVVNGDKGWTKVAGNTIELDKDAVAEAKEKAHAEYVASLLPLIDGKGYTMATTGEFEVGEKKAMGVKVTSKGHRDVDLYFDKETGLLVQYDVKVKDEGSGQEVLESSFPSDYKDLKGTKYAKKAIVKRDGKLYLAFEVTEI